MFLVVSALHSPAPVGATQSPQDVVQGTAERMLTMLREERELIEKSPGRINELVEKIVVPNFDFDRMAQWVLGKYWRTADAEQRRRFVTEFRTLLVRTYASSLNEYVDRKITFFPLTIADDATEATVRSEVEQPGSFPVAINYDLHLGPDGWKVYDVTIDGVSLVLNYRTSFSNEIRANGLDTFVQQLATRNRERSTQ